MFKFNNVLRCLESRATIGIASSATARPPIADHLRGRDNAAGINDNSAEIGNNSSEISDDAAGIVDIAAKVIAF